MSDVEIAGETEGSNSCCHAIGAGEVEPELTWPIAPPTAAITGHTSAAGGPRSKGTGRAVVKRLVGAATRKALKIVPLCPLVHRTHALAA